MVKKKRAVFDRDGVLIEAPVIDGYPKSTQKLQDIKICNGVRELCDELRKRFFFVYGYQPTRCCSRNINSRKNVDDINFFLKKELLLDDIFICYCSEDNAKIENLILNYLYRQKKYLINLEESYMIGDRWRDIDAANNANCASILIERGYKETLNSKPTYTIQKIKRGKKIN